MVILVIILLILLIYVVCKINKLIVKAILLIPIVMIGLGFILAFIFASIPALNNGGI